MIAPFLSRMLWHLFRLTFWAGLLSVAALLLLRLGIWATGSAQMGRDLNGPPQIIRWDVDHPDFGGLSALIMAADGTSLLAGGDHGTMVEAQITRGAAGEVARIGTPTLTPVSLRSGHPPTEFKMDLEGLTRDPKGGLLTAFEGYVRIEHLPQVGGRPRATHYWDAFVHLFGNQAFEALATLPDARAIAITEDTGEAASTLWDGDSWTPGPAIPVTSGYRITGADVGPDGCLYLVERRFNVLSGFTFGLRRLSGGPDTWNDTLLYRAAPSRLGNAEGLSVWEDAAGQMMLSVITDDGFLPLTATRLIEFRARPGVGCGFGF